MARYGKRTEELEQHLRQTSTFPVEQAGTLLSRIVRGIELRDSTLVEMCALLAREDTEPIHARLEELCQSVQAGWVQGLSRSLDSVSDPDRSLDLWREGQTAYEAAFFGRLSELKLGAERDAMAALEVSLADLTRSLQYKWSTMTEEARRLEQAEAEASRRLTEVLNQSIQDSTAHWKRWGDTAFQLVDFFKQLPGQVNRAVVSLAIQAGFPEEVAEAIPRMSDLGRPLISQCSAMGILPGDVVARVPLLCRDPGMFVCDQLVSRLPIAAQAAIGLISASYGVLLEASVEYQRQVALYQRVIPNHGVVVVSLGQTQHDVDEYLKNCGLDKVRAILDRVDSGLSAWTSSLPTEGQRADAQDFKSAVLDAFKRRYERMVNLFGVFVQSNQGRFIGQVSRQVEDELIFTDVWLDREQNLFDMGMDVRIREWRALNMKVTDELRAASSQLESSLGNLPQELRGDILTRVTRLCSGMVEQLEREMQTGNTELQKAETLLAPDKIRQDLNRAALRQKLAC